MRRFSRAARRWSQAATETTALLCSHGHQARDGIASSKFSQTAFSSMQTRSTVVWSAWLTSASGTSVALQPGRDTMVQPYEKHELLRKRRMLMWCLLAFGAGAVNATGLLACRSFVSHLTGTVTNLAAGFVGDLALNSAVVFLCFVFGAMCSALLLFRLQPRGGWPPFWAPLAVVGSLLMTVAVLGQSGVFGPFGDDIAAPNPNKVLALLSCLSFAMGMQNAAVATITGQAIRTTHMTGSVSDLGVDLARAAVSENRERATAIRWSVLRFTKIASFACGAGVAALVGIHLEFLTLLLPAACVLAVFVLEIVGRPRETSRAIEEPGSPRHVVGSWAGARG